MTEKEIMELTKLNTQLRGSFAALELTVLELARNHEFLRAELTQSNKVILRHTILIEQLQKQLNERGL